LRFSPCLIDEGRDGQNRLISCQGILADGSFALA
jgi:hypothetical protein